MSKVWRHIDEHANRYSLLLAFLAIIIPLIYSEKIIYVFKNSESTTLNEKANTQFSTGELTFFAFALIFLLMAITLFVRYQKIRLLRKLVFKPDQPYHKRTKDLVSEHLMDNKLLTPLKFTNVTTVTDIIDAAKKIYYPHIKGSKIQECVIESRKYAYTKKYSHPSPNEEKIIGEKIYGHWEDHFHKVLKLLYVSGLEQAKILDVGVGNANTYSNNFLKYNSYLGIDLSNEAMSNAKKKFPNFGFMEGEAEHLPIENNTIDIYISFRTFQSTLFDRRKAVIEAKRVVRPGGQFIVTIPILYYISKKGNFIHGLFDADEKNSMKYAFQVANEIKEYLKMLNFSNVGIYDKSEYEIFIYGTSIV